MQGSFKPLFYSENIRQIPVSDRLNISYNAFL